MKKHYLLVIPFYKNKYFLIPLSLIFISILIAITYLIFAPKKEINKNSEPLIYKSLLDTRFLVLYGKITKISTDSIDIEVVKDPTLTDYVFDDIKSLNLIINKDSIIKGFDVEKKVYSDLKLADIKRDSFVTAYIDNATSSGYKAIGLKMFTENIIK